MKYITLSILCFFAACAVFQKQNRTTKAPGSGAFQPIYWLDTSTNRMEYQLPLPQKDTLNVSWFITADTGQILRAPTCKHVFVAIEPDSISIYDLRTGPKELICLKCNKRSRQVLDPFLWDSISIIGRQPKALIPPAKTRYTAFRFCKNQFL